MGKVVVITAAVLCILPLYFLAIGSVTTEGAFLQMPPTLWPQEITFDNYRQFPGIGRWAGNTLVVGVCGIIGIVGVSCATGYVFAFHSFPLKRILWPLMLAGMMVPRLALMIPKYSVMMKLGLIDTRAGLILSEMLYPATVYMARTFFETVPQAIRDAAKIDGAGEVGILARIVIPMSKPLIACVIVFAGVMAISDYVWQAQVLQTPGKQTLIVGLMQSIGQGPGGSIGQELAAGVLMSIPMLAVFLVSSRFFIKGLGGAVKE